MPGINDGRPDTALLALIREHSRRAPAGSVDWNALAARIVEDGRGELAARQRAAYDSDGVRTLLRRPAPRRWWEVTAGWARPAIAAALIVSAISTAVVLASPSVAVADTGDSSAAAWLQALGATSTVTAATPATRDSLFVEVIGE
jgi:hypothetical protein